MEACRAIALTARRTASLPAVRGRVQHQRKEKSLNLGGIYISLKAADPPLNCIKSGEFVEGRGQLPPASSRVVVSTVLPLRVMTLNVIAADEGFLSPHPVLHTKINGRSASVAAAMVRTSLTPSVMVLPAAGLTMESTSEASTSKESV